VDDKTGGPAFPIDIKELERVYTGMTLLDYFAGQAMQICTITDHKNAAVWCYNRAKVMIKEGEELK
tara:strand:- start:61 stop:258 length:198 start_codon:yes stop_codon:yes gene_type:complete